MKLSRIAVAVVATASLIAVADVSAQTPGPDFVKQRTEFMSSMWRSGVSQFRNFASGQDTNAAPVAEAATRLAALAADIQKWFPPGTDQASLPGSRTKPDVWTKKADFDAAIAKLVDESKKLASLAASGNADAIKAQITVVTTACGGCHGGPAASGGAFRFEKAQ